MKTSYHSLYNGGCDKQYSIRNYSPKFLPHLILYEKFRWGYLLEEIYNFKQFIGIGWGGHPPPSKLVSLKSTRFQRSDFF